MRLLTLSNVILNKGTPLHFGPCPH